MVRGYRNDCLLNQAICKSKGTIRKVKDGECDSSKDSERMINDEPIDESNSSSVYPEEPIVSDPEELEEQQPKKQCNQNKCPPGGFKVCASDGNTYR